MIGVVLIVLILFFGLYKLIALSSVKFTAFAIDFLLIFFYTIYYLHNLVSVKISSGYAIYFWDFVFGLIAIGIYGSIILTIHHLFPTISKVLNYIISVIGVSVAVPLAISFATATINMFNSNIKTTEHIQLLNNDLADKIVYIVIFVLLAIPVWQTRMEKLDN